MSAKKNAINLNLCFLSNDNFRFFEKHIEKRINFAFVIENKSFNFVNSKNNFIEMKYPKNNVTLLIK